MRTPEGWSREYQGPDVEQAYVKAYGWHKSSDNVDNYLGIDLFTGNIEFPVVQAKSSIEIARKFLINSVILTIKSKKSQFIPLCIGEPAKTEVEVFDSIRKFGVYISPDVFGDRNGFINKVAEIRDMCYNPERIPKAYKSLAFTA